MNEILSKLKLFFKKYSWANKAYGLVRNPIRIKNIRNNGEETLKIIKDALGSLNISYFLDYGTLLGFVRDRNFIPYDLDIDIGVLNTNEKDIKLIEQSMLNFGFKKTHEFEYNGTITEQAYIRNGVKVDLFYYINKNNESIAYSFYRIPEVEYPSIDKFTPFKFTYTKIQGIEVINVNGIELNIPKNAELLLSEKYGDNWRIPNKNWKYSDSPSIKIDNGYGTMYKFNK